MNLAVYAPKSDFVAKLRRRAARYTSRRMLRPELDRGLISLSFDDCPRSVVDNALPQIEARGWQATIYASMGLCGTTNHLGLHMSEHDMVEAHRRGHEIGDHTYSHIDGLQSPTGDVQKDIEKNRAVFERLGLPKAETFAYPYGEVTPSLKRMLSGEFDLLRGVHSPSKPQLDLGLAASGRLYSGNINETLSLLEDAAREKSWLILFGHDVRPDPSEFGCTPAELTHVLDRISTLSLDVSNVRDALRKTTT